MLDMVWFLGALLGNAANPIIWIIVVVTLASTRQRSGFARIAASILATVVIGAFLYSIDGFLTLREKVRGLAFSGFVAAVLASIWVGFQKLRHRQS